MKNKLFLILLLGLFVFVRCETAETRQVGTSALLQQQAIDNQSVSDNNFPPELVGVWRGYGNGWEIHFAKDGSISEVLRVEGLRMDLSEEFTEKASHNNEIYVRYTYGDCFWSYDGETSILKATVTLDNYYANVKETLLSCVMVDEFEGQVSEDKMTWTANWKTVTTFDNGKPDQISTDRILIFNKLP